MSEKKENHFYEGLWTHFTCAECSAMNEIEGDLKGEVVECDACGKSAEIE